LGQDEIIIFLRNKRLTGDHSFFSIHEISKGINGGSNHYSSVRRSLYQLRKMEIVDTQTTGDVFEWVKTFRLNKKYCKAEKKKK
jgi:hypothetical protein